MSERYFLSLVSIFFGVNATVWSLTISGRVRSDLKLFRSYWYPGAVFIAGGVVEKAVVGHSGIRVITEITGNPPKRISCLRLLNHILTRMKMFPPECSDVA